MISSEIAGINAKPTTIPHSRAAKKYVLKNKLKVEFRGFVENVEEVLSSTKIAFVSRYLSILESMAAKKIVFAHYNNAIKKDYLVMAPFAKDIIIENNPKKMAQEIENYLKNSSI